MTIVWDGFATIGLTLPLFPQFSSIIHFHGIIMWIVTALSLGGIIPEIIVTGFVPGGILTLHYTCGLIVLLEVVFICLLGRLLRIKKVSMAGSPNTVYIITRIHAILGILLYLTAQLAVLSKWYILYRSVFYWIDNLSDSFSVGADNLFPVPTNSQGQSQRLPNRSKISSNRQEDKK